MASQSLVFYFGDILLLKLYSEIKISSKSLNHLS